MSSHVFVGDGNAIGNYSLEVWHGFICIEAFMKFKLVRMEKYNFIQYATLVLSNINNLLSMVM